MEILTSELASFTLSMISDNVQPKLHVPMRMHATSKYQLLLSGPKQAKELYEKAAAQNHVIAQLRLAMLYEHGIGVKKNPKKAKAWYKKAAALDYDYAQEQLDLMSSQKLDDKL